MRDVDAGEGESGGRVKVDKLIKPGSMTVAGRASPDMIVVARVSSFPNSIAERFTRDSSYSPTAMG